MSDDFQKYLKAHFVQPDLNVVIFERIIEKISIINNTHLYTVLFSVFNRVRQSQERVMILTDYVCMFILFLKSSSTTYENWTNEVLLEAP